MAEFNYETTVSVRFQDLDVAGHVNNAVYVTYLEEARIDYVRDVLGIESVEELSAVVAHVEVDYRQPVTEDRQLTVALRALEPGDASIPMEYELRADSEVVATAETVMVTVDYETGETRPMPEAWREQLTAYEGY